MNYQEQRAEIMGLLKEIMQDIPAFKKGRECLDPLNRVVTMVDQVDGMVVVKLAGPYGATCFYPPSCLRILP